MLNLFTLVGLTLVLANPAFAVGPAVDGQLFIAGNASVATPAPVAPVVTAPVLIAPNDTPASPIDDSKCALSVTKLDADLAADKVAKYVDVGRYKFTQKDTQKLVEFVLYKVVAPSGAEKYIGVVVDSNNCVDQNSYPATLTVDIVNGLVGGTL